MEIAKCSFSVIIRYLRGLNWAVLAISARILIVLEVAVACVAFGYFCLPECGYERAAIILVGIGSFHIQRHQKTTSSAHWKSLLSFSSQYYSDAICDWS